MKRVFYWMVLHYIRGLARLQLKKINPLIIGITGSAGKTSLMNAVEAVLKDKYKIKVSYKANSETGIPLNILGLPSRSYGYLDWLWLMPLAAIKLVTNWEKYEVYIVEMGVDGPDAPNNMEYLLRIVKPKIGVFLNVSPVHTELFNKLSGDPVDNIAKEKGKLIESLPEDGLAILNFKDKRVRAFKDKTKAKVVGFEREKVEIKGLVLDEYFSSTFAGAIATAKVLGISKEEAKKSLKKNFKLPPGRMTKIQGIKGTILLDSSYNASRKSMIGALKTLGKNKGKKIAVLGDMRELGKQAKREHELVAEEAVKQADVLVTVGPLMKKYFMPKVLQLGFKESGLYWFDNSYEAGLKLRDEIIKGKESILIKASQNTLFFEIIVKELMKNPKIASKILCRRGRFWDKKRQVIKKLVQS